MPSKTSCSLPSMSIFNRSMTGSFSSFKNWPSGTLSTSTVVAEAMAGALILGLTVDYFTEEELGHLLSSCAKSFSENHPNESAVKNEYDIYQLTRATDIHARFRRSIGVGDIHRSGVQPAATIEEAIFKAAMLLSSLARGDETDSPYYSPAELIRTFAGRQIVLIEDWSLSGTTLVKNVERLYKLWNIVFSQKFTGELLQTFGFAPPKFRRSLRWTPSFRPRRA